MKSYANGEGADAGGWLAIRATSGLDRVDPVAKRWQAKSTTLHWPSEVRPLASHGSSKIVLPFARHKDEVRPEHALYGFPDFALCPRGSRNSRIGGMERYLTRNGDELTPVEVDEIVVIRGAQDYAEVVTSDGKAHLVRMSLSECEARLPRSRYLRVH